MRFFRLQRWRTPLLLLLNSPRRAARTFGHRLTSKQVSMSRLPCTLRIGRFALEAGCCNVEWCSTRPARPTSSVWPAQRSKAAVEEEVFHRADVQTLALSGAGCPIIQHATPLLRPSRLLSALAVVFRPLATQFHLSSPSAPDARP